MTSLTLLVFWGRGRGVHTCGRNVADGTLYQKTTGSSQPTATKDAGAPYLITGSLTIQLDVLGMLSVRIPKLRCILCFRKQYSKAVLCRQRTYSVGYEISCKTCRTVGYRCGSFNNRTNTACRVRHRACTKNPTRNRAFLHGYARTPGKGQYVI